MEGVARKEPIRILWTERNAFRMWERKSKAHHCAGPTHFAVDLDDSSSSSSQTAIIYLVDISPASRFEAPHLNGT